MRKFRLILYYLIFSKLPSSWWPGGRYFNALRFWCLQGLMHVGHGTKIQKDVYVGKGDDIRIGADCQINELVRLDNVHIGDNVMIARETVFLGKAHGSGDAGRPMSEQGVVDFPATIVSDDVWIGLRVTVMPGLFISKGTIIGAGAVVTKSTEPYGVYGGVPARLIRKRA